MKKLIAVLAIAIVLVGAVFAEETSGKLVLSSTVGQVKPEFKITTSDKSGEQGASVSKTGTTGGVTVLTGKDITEEPIEWTFEVLQKGEADSKEYSRYKGSVTLTIALSKFTGTVNGATATQAEDPYVKSVVAGDDVDDGQVAGGRLHIVAGSANATSTTLTLTYGGKKVNDQVVGTIVGYWTKDENLPTNPTGVDTIYTANVTLTYEVQ